MIGPRPHTSRLWSVIHWAMVMAYVYFVGFKVGSAWQEATSLQPELAFIDWALRSLQLQAPTIAAWLLVLVAILAFLSGFPRFARSAPLAPDEAITPVMVLHRHPIHLGFCVAILLLTVWGMFTAPRLAMAGIAAAIWAFVSLARQLGLEPPNDPAAPQNQGKV